MHQSPDPNDTQATWFASAERADRESVATQAAIVEAEFASQPILEVLPNLLLVLNAQRQVVFANQALMDSVDAEGVEFLKGLRPGEILDCMHAGEMAAGCGTSEACSTCGAAKAIIKSIGGASDIQECRIIQKQSGDALDYRVLTKPLEIENERYILFVLIDISDEKRRRVLERIFFHDILNTAGGLRGFTELLSEMVTGEEAEMADTVHHIAEAIIDEIQAHKDLMAAENHELTVHRDALSAETMVNQVARMYKQHVVAEGREIEVAAGEDVWFQSDQRLIKRVVGNMLKNALEASKSGEVVGLGWKREDSQVMFWVQNPAVIPRESQLQIFKRSYSTKGAGRGLGTHSMKLLTERYLGGQVSFTSDEGEGTVFRACFPIQAE